MKVTMNVLKDPTKRVLKCEVLEGGPRCQDTYKVLEKGAEFEVSKYTYARIYKGDPRVAVVSGDNSESVDVVEVSKEAEAVKQEPVSEEVGTSKKEVVKATDSDGVDADFVSELNSAMEEGLAAKEIRKIFKKYGMKPPKANKKLMEEAKGFLG